MPARKLTVPKELTSGPFTTWRAQRVGLSQSALRNRAFRRVGPQVYAMKADLDLIDRVNAHALTLPDDVLVEGVTALHLYGVEIGETEVLAFCSIQGRDIRRRGVRVRRVTKAPPHQRRIVTPIGALMTAAGDLHLVDLVAAGDWLIRRELVTLTELRSALGAARGPHARKLRRAGELIRERVDSPQESRLRMLGVLAGLPEPVCNVRLGSEHFFIAQVDLLHELWKLALEYEGDQHRVEKAQWNRDIDRFEELGAEGYVVIRVTAARLRRPRALVQKIHAALVRLGYDGPAPVFSAEWLSYFESGNSALARAR